MRKVSNIVLLLIISLVIITCDVVKMQTSRQVPTFRLNITSNYEEKWKEVAEYFKPNIHAFIEFFNKEYSIPSFVYKMIGIYGEHLYHLKDFTQELKVLSKLMEVDYGTIFLINFLYELTSFPACSGVIYRDENGNILHGRNLDFNWAPYVANVTFNAEVYKDNKHIFTANGLAGVLFFHTGLKLGKFAINEDTRTGGSILSFFYNLMFTNSIPSVYLIRKVLEEEDSFESAVERLKSTRTIQPIYYIISGVKPNEGLVIEKSVEGIHAEYSLNSKLWYIVQTNYDRDQVDPEADRRRIPVEEKIRSIGQGMSIENFKEKIMAQPPTLRESTILTTMMSAHNDYFNTTLWY